MINNISIKNFKSIKSLDIKCEKINIFIGEPNVGKSNILEAIGLFYYPVRPQDLREYIRFENIGNLFYQQNIENNIEINMDDNYLFKLENLNNFFKFSYYLNKSILSNTSNIRNSQDWIPVHSFECNFNLSSISNLTSGTNEWVEYFSKFKFYRFPNKIESEYQEPGYLTPPFGKNISQVIINHKKIQTLIKTIVEGFGLKLALRQDENKIEFLLEEDDVYLIHPLVLLSDTIKRLIFYLVAIKSNKNSVICLEEPEVHAFPVHIKYLAETIALDPNNNQYFIATHNPLILNSLIEKVKKQNLAIFLTYLENRKTKIKELTYQDIQEILDLDLDVFFNIDRFLESNE